MLFIYWNSHPINYSTYNFITHINYRLSDKITGNKKQVSKIKYMHFCITDFYISCSYYIYII